ncbi:hypothetical protein C8Q76DRAFT_98394 [Earliella scabrosa]|nr:hypothetical protein C8Q76DRAFT_98394 [Earliella scabrosa]
MQYAQCTPFGRTRIAGRMAQDECHFISRAEMHHISQRCVHGVHSWPVRVNQRAISPSHSFLPPCRSAICCRARLSAKWTGHGQCSARWQYRRAHVPQRTCESSGWVQLAKPPVHLRCCARRPPPLRCPGCAIFASRSSWWQSQVHASRHGLHRRAGLVPHTLVQRFGRAYRDMYITASSNSAAFYSSAPSVQTPAQQQARASGATLMLLPLAAPVPAPTDIRWTL